MGGWVESLKILYGLLDSKKTAMAVGGLIGGSLPILGVMASASYADSKVKTLDDKLQIQLDAGAERFNLINKRLDRIERKEDINTEFNYNALNTIFHKVNGDNTINLKRPKKLDE